MTMREDFCGTAVLSLAWARSHRKRRAFGVDLDQATLQWGLKHRIEPAGEDVARRVELKCADVMDGGGPRVDITCALNFSYCIFKERARLLDYLRAARKGLAPGGILVMDVLGGLDSMVEEINEEDHDEFVYRWDQERFDPLTHDFLAHISFEFPDGSALKNAFTYDWRLWTVPELRDLLEEAGFSRVRVLWERTDDDNEGTGSFYEPKRGVENQEVWWTYIIAER